MEILQSKYKSCVEWRKAEPEQFKDAFKDGSMENICRVFGWRMPNGYWSLERIMESAQGKLPPEGEETIKKLIQQDKNI